MQKLRIVNLLAALAVIGAPVAVSAYAGIAQAQTKGMEHRDARRDTRQDSRQGKQACKAGDNSRAECRQEKRDTKQTGRQTGHQANK